MTQQKKTTVAPKAPKKLVPRTAPQAEAALPVPAPAAESVAAVVEPVVTPTPATASAVKANPAKKPVAKPAAKPVTKAVAVVAEVPEEQKPLEGKPAKAKKEPKAEKPAKARKVKLVRDSYAMPDVEYAQINVLKKRLAGMKQEVKKSELLRAGIAVLCALNDEELAVVMSHIERIKTGRPGK